MDETHNIKNIFKFITIIITILLIIFILYGLKIELFQDKMIIVNYIKGFGIIAPIIFLLFQILQVIFPIIPGGASCLVGVLAFGPLLGFIYNYIGLTLGSIIVFLLSRIYGIKLIYKLFKKDNVDKYLKYVKNNKFEKIFFLTILIPGLPDDLLCYIAGISKLDFKRFLFIILTGKTLSLLMYSIFIKIF